MDATQPVASEQLKKIYGELEAEINQLINNFWSKKQGQLAQAAQSVAAQATAQGGGAAQSLPWFRHGIKGFLRKLWYGDGHENPDWQNYAQEHLSLENYNLIKEELEGFLVEYQADPEVGSLVRSIMSSILRAFKKAGTVVRPAAATPDAPTSPQPAPSDNGPEPAPVAPADTTATEPPEPASAAASPTQEPASMNTPVVDTPKTKKVRPTITPEQYEHSARNLSDIFHKFSSLPDEMTSSEKADYETLQKSAVEQLKSIGIDMTREGKISNSLMTAKRTASTLIKLVKEMQKLQPTQHLSWDNIDSYNIFPFAGNKIPDRIRTALEELIHAEKSPVQAEPAAEEPAMQQQIAHAIHQYDNMKNIHERADFLKSNLSTPGFKVILKSRKMPTNEKIKYLKESLA